MSSGRGIAPPLERTEGKAARTRLWHAVRGGASVLFDWDLVHGRVLWSDDPAALFSASEPRPQSAEDGHTIELAILPEDRVGRAEHLSRIDPRGGEFEAEYRVRDTAGIFWVSERARVAFDAKGRACRVSGVLQGVTERKEREAKLERAAYFDPLTSHFSRLRLGELIGQAMGARGGGYLTLAVDRASEVRDAFGHEAFEAVVQEVGRRIASGVRGADAIGRVAPAQFGVLVKPGGKRELKALGERLLGLVRTVVVTTPMGPVAVTLSAGAIALREAKDVNAVFQGGDEALAEANLAGGDRCLIYAAAPGREDQRRRNRGMTEMVLSALEEDRLRLAFQPLVEARSGRVVQYEALVRMIGRDGQVVPAADFMPAVERLGLARLIDRRTLDLAMTELAESRVPRLALNVSALTAADTAWLRELEKRLATMPDAAARLTIEITETAVLDSFHTTEHFVARLRSLGCAVALDDFGAGHTSFRHLRGLAVNVVKIDRAFVGDLAQRPDNRLVVRAVRDLAQGLGLATVAEGVENAEDAGILTEIGVDLLQGYHFGRPGFERPWREKRPLRLVANAG